ncbi:TIR domain-containing protein [Pantoea ananatis]|uniref:TIR domain-containing protein n=1 Tax=Pantoea ananas TaxID=553 RepID=UPI001FF0BC1A|nr:nucleotide-binding protein [Pantoea ananatis]
MYFNTIIEIEEKDKKGSYLRFYDLDNEDIEDVKKYIIYPYLKKEEIFIDGRNIDASKVRMIKIKEAKTSTNDLQSIAQNRVPQGVLMFHTRITVLNDTYTNDITKKILTEVGAKLKDNESRKIEDSIKNNIEINNNIFIVHGRDDLAKTEVARFIEKLGLKAIILHEQDSNGKTIIEKIEEHTNVGYGIVLYTPCDYGGLTGESETKPRARQNVLFEHGYLIGKLGRNKVCALVKSDVEIPNDLSGLVYTQLDAPGAWKLSIAKELTKEGYSIDPSKLLE